MKCQFLALLALMALSPRPAAANLAPQVTAAAQREGTVVFYSAMDAKTLDGAVRQFNATHPGITVQALHIDANNMPARITLERTAGKFIADVVSTPGIPMSQLALAGMLQARPPTDPGKFVKGSVDPSGLWTSLFYTTTVIAWNPQKLKADGLKPPANLADLAKPEWKGKIGIDSTAFNWYSAMLATQPGAHDLLAKIVANEAVLTSGHTETVMQLASGEFDVTPTAYGYMAQHERKLGEPVAFLNYRPLIVESSPVALMKDAPHPNAAKVFIDWLLSKSGQDTIVQLSERTSGRIDAVNDHLVFPPHQPIFEVPSPTKAEYQTIVSQYRALLSVPQ